MVFSFVVVAWLPSNFRDNSNRSVDAREEIAERLGSGLPAVG